MDRLQKVIASMGVCSRRHAEILIQEGRIKINGEVVTKLGTTVSDTDKIFLDDKPLLKEEKVYYMLNKPKYTITTLSDTKNRPTVMSCFKDVKERIYPIGRLDFDTTGILLFSNDGDLAYKIMHPSKEINKTYITHIKAKISKEELAKLEKGVLLNDGMSYPAKTTLLGYDIKNSESIVSLTIHEGRYHQVKRMFEAIGYKVTSLDRYSICGLNYGNLKQGEYRKLTDKEIEKLKKEVK